MNGPPNSNGRTVHQAHAVTPWGGYLSCPRPRPAPRLLLPMRISRRLSGLWVALKSTLVAYEYGASQGGGYCR